MAEMEELGKTYCSRLQEKLKLLNSFARATAGMKDAIRSSDAQRMALHARQRQTVISKVNEIDKIVEGFARGKALWFEGLSHKTKAMIMGYVDQIGASLEALAGAEKECLALAEAERDSVRSDILQKRRGMAVAKAYRGAGHAKPRFLDTKK